MIKFEVKLIDGTTDGCVVEDAEALIIIESFAELKTLIIGSADESMSIYPAASVFSIFASKVQP